MKKVNIDLNEETKKKIIVGIVIAVVIAIVVCIALYIGNQGFRTFVDRYILRKEIVQNNVASIDISSLEAPSIYAYDKYITILNKNKLTTYSNLGKKEYEHEIRISDAIYASNNRFLAVAEKNGRKLYLISEQNILWETEIEGEIQKINVNKNGYVSIIITGGGRKAIVTTYSPNGKELFKTYLSSTMAIDTDISNDNKYLSIAEINVSGTLIQSNIKVISIEKAASDPINSVIYIHKSETNKLITDIKYQDKNKLTISYDDGIRILYEESETEVVSFEKNRATFASIGLNNYSTYTIEKTTGLLNTNTQIILKNVNGAEKENIYTANGVIKSLKACGNNIALNLGSTIEFINTSGWLVKRYISEKEIKDLVVAEKVAGIVYQDKIEIATL